jgi:hypothetical protein
MAEHLARVRVTLDELAERDPAAYGRFMDAALALLQGGPIACPVCSELFATRDEWLAHVEGDAPGD